MGLDIVEFVMGVEEAVGVPIPNAVAANITTPRMLIDYLYSQLPQSRVSHCLTQRAFYQIRRGLIHHVGRSYTRLQPNTELMALLPTEDAQTIWAEIGDTLGYPRWPRIRGQSWLARWIGWQRPRTLGEAAEYVAGTTPASLKPPGEGWSWHEVAATVDWQLRQHFAVRDYSFDDRFAEDLGMD